MKCSTNCTIYKIQKVRGRVRGEPKLGHMMTLCQLEEVAPLMDTTQCQDTRLSWWNLGWISALMCLLIGMPVCSELSAELHVAAP